MVRFFRTLTKRFLIIFNILAVLVFLLACLAPYANPVNHFYIALLGVGFIFISLAVFAFFLFWLLFRSAWALLSLSALLIGWKQISVVFAFHPFAKFTDTKAPGSYRIMTWNVSRWDEMNKKLKGGTSDRLKMFDFIAKQDADILCIQEFFESRRPDLFDMNVSYIKKKLNYPYHMFAVDFVTYTGYYEHGVALFSRYPIIDSFRMKYPAPDSVKASESLIRATIDLNGKKINVFTTHLQSFLFTRRDYQRISNIKKADDTDSVVVASKGILDKFMGSYIFRSRQAEIVSEKLNESTYPEIICGDFNDVPNSYTYSTIKGDRQDAFVRKGFGIGRSFQSISPTLRIDYILADKAFNILQFKKTNLPYSDHFPLMADFQLPKENR